MLVEKQNSLELRGSQLLQWLQQETSFEVETLEMISGDASFRRYFRFIAEDKNFIAVDAPPEKESNHEFYHIARSYHAAGVKVPEIMAVDLQKGFWVLEDFGDELLSHHYTDENIENLYAEALSSLIPIQSVLETEQGGLPKFDDTLLDMEFHLFNHWLLEVHLKLELNDGEKNILKDTQALIRKVFKEQPQGGVHRDYHSRNLMVLNDKSNVKSTQIGVIDFQDAVIGPVTYDAVSLLRDCYVVWPKDMVNRLLNNWFQQAGFEADVTQLRYWFDFVGMQRHIKASGIFCRLCYRDGKALYLNDIPRTLGYLVDVAAQYQETTAFGSLVANRILPAVLALEAA